MGSIWQRERWPQGSCFSTENLLLTSCGWHWLIWRLLTRSYFSGYNYNLGACSLSFQAAPILLPSGPWRLVFDTWHLKEPFDLPWLWLTLTNSLENSSPGFPPSTLSPEVPCSSFATGGWGWGEKRVCFKHSWWQFCSKFSEFRGCGANRKFHASAKVVANRALVIYMVCPQPASHEIAC